MVSFHIWNKIPSDVHSCLFYTMTIKMKRWSIHVPLELRCFTDLSQHIKKILQMVSWKHSSCQIIIAHLHQQLNALFVLLTLNNCCTLYSYTFSEMLLYVCYCISFFLFLCILWCLIHRRFPITGTLQK